MSEGMNGGRLDVGTTTDVLELLENDVELPINPRQSPRVFRAAVDAITESLGPDHPQLHEFLSILSSLENIPPYTESQPDRAAERQREKEVARGRLARLASECREVREGIEGAVRRFNGEAGRPDTFDALHELVEQQAYRLFECAANGQHSSSRDATCHSRHSRLKASIVAFARTNGNDAVLFVAPRLFCSSLETDRAFAPLGEDCWKTSRVLLSPDLAHRTFRQAITGADLRPTTTGSESWLFAGQMIETVPIGILESFITNPPLYRSRIPPLPVGVTCVPHYTSRHSTHML